MSSCVLYDATNENHIKSFMVTAKVFDVIIQENFPDTAIRFPRNLRVDTAYDFLCMQAMNAGIHSEILKRNVFVAAQKVWPNLNERDFLIVVNLFLIIYITNCHNIVSDNNITLSCDILTYEGLVDMVDHMGGVMEDVITHGFGMGYTPSDMEVKLINYEKAYANVVGR